MAMARPEGAPGDLAAEEGGGHADLGHAGDGEADGDDDLPTGVLGDHREVDEPGRGAGAGDEPRPAGEVGGLVRRWTGHLGCPFARTPSPNGGAAVARLLQQGYT